MSTTATPIPVPTVPVLPDTPGAYRQVERFLLDLHKPTLENPEIVPWSLEDLARLARLEADILSDISRLETFAEDVHGLVTDAVDCDRNRGLRAA